MQQNTAIHQIAAQTGDMHELVRQLFEEISKFQITQDDGFGEEHVR